ncbi:CCR4-NOT core subunit NOT3 TDEL_0H02330 [Torulaspora delbrueckii]|uniref:General negative regulator of transcription subunit n=1 Tax=Torulaspora delbrueckii TaxID=4950 RepID=G8ZZP8_TORDE|nr:hypothetical protein TDEL_0H02330 [Torulaspora delbrueckii]CCE94092.1 hypothetical protein TDEL_0H02330 [Torulaspora delbrueckii]
MAHRKLQQEIDRVFKKINEGLEIFDTYYERHENCTNNPSQKDKLESDLKREVKKLQRLREQIKSWQSSPEIKDKDSLLDYRRSVETAMEKYKAVEKASKEKAYSNISLKKSDLLDPQERERRDVSEFLSGTIDELERQYDGLQVEVDRLILLNKKKKTASSANEQQKEQLKALQARYRWHQQQIELALRLLANEELDPDSVKEVQDDINYFVDSNQDPDFVEDETIYDALNLQSNEAIAHEVAQYFASQLAEDNADEEDSRDASRLSKKEQRKLERDAKKAAKAAAKSKPEEEVPASPVDESEAVELPKSKSASPEQKTTEPLKSVPSSAAVPATTKSPNGLGATIPKASLTSSTPSNNNHESHSGHTHIHQSLNGVTTTSTLKPATVPIRPAGELKWAVAASQGVEKDKKISSSISATNVAGTVNNQTTASSTSASSAISSRATSATNTPRLAAQSLEPSNLAQLDNSAYGSSNSLSANTAAAVLAAGAAAVHLNNKAIHRNNSSSHQLAEALNYRNLSGDSSSKADLNQTENLEDVSAPDLVIDDYEPELTDDEIENEPVPEHLSAEEYIKRTEAKEQMRKELIEDYELLLLPSGIQEFIMGTHLFTKGLEPLDGKVGGFRRSCDTCNIPRFDEVPLGVNPPAPLDAFRSTQQWDITRCSLRSIIQNGDLNDDEKYEAIIEKFRSLEMFTLFYNYYFAVTPLEQTIASLVLSERNWKVSKSGTLWFLRQGEPKFANEVCEVADYKIFKLDDWTVADKPNFKLDYAALKEAPATLPSAQKDQSIDTNGLNDLSHGQQLLQQLKQGKIAVSD